MKKTLFALSSFVFAVLLSACSPEVGTKAWCEDMGGKPKGDWTANDATQFAKYCAFKNYKDE